MWSWYSITTDSAGLFRFLDLAAGVYNLSAQASGFKTHVEDSIRISAGESRDLGRLALEVGSQAEAVTVDAQATPVQVSSKRKRSSDRQPTGRCDPQRPRRVRFMQLLPGVLDTSNREILSTAGDGGISTNGNTTSMSNIADGIPGPRRRGERRGSLRTTRPARIPETSLRFEF